MAKEKKVDNQSKKKPRFYRFIIFWIKLFYRKREHLGQENMPEEASIYVTNHAQYHMPFSTEFYFPTKKYIWCIGEMMKAKEVPAYTYKDFWSHKPKWTKWFFKMLSHLIAHPAAYLMSNADTIAVYKDTRMLGTYRETMRVLDEGYNVVLAPEKPEPFNDVVNEFQDKFIDVARLYYAKYKKCVSFVPVYNAGKLKKVVMGKPIKYDPKMNIDEQRKIICDYLKEQITAMAKELPVHYVVPYDNIPKKLYKKNK